MFVNAGTELGRIQGWFGYVVRSNTLNKMKKIAKVGSLLRIVITPGSATSLFSCKGVFTSRVIFRYVFPSKIAISRSLLCLFRRFLFRGQIRRVNSIPHAMRDSCFSTDEEGEGGGGVGVCKSADPYLFFRQIRRSAKRFVQIRNHNHNRKQKCQGLKVNWYM